VLRVAIPPGVRDMLIATLLFAVMATLVKEVERHLPVAYAVFSRSAVSLVLSLVWLQRARLRWRGNRPVLLALRGLIGFSALFCTFESLARLSLSDAVILYQTQPLWTVLIARIVLGERAHPRVLLATLVALSGVVLVLRPNFLFGAETAHAVDPLGFALALAAALLSAGAYVTVRALRTTDEPLVIVFWFALVATPASLPGVLADLRWPTPYELLLLLGIGLTVQAAQLLMTRALHREPAGRIAAVGYLQVVYAFVLGVLVFDEPLVPLAIAGAILVVAGALIATIERPHPTLDSAPHVG